MRSLTFLFTTFTCLATAVVTFAQAPTVSKSVTIDVADAGGDTSTTNKWRTYYGSGARTQAVTRELSLRVRNMSAAPGEFEIEWFFVGKETSGSKQFLYDKGSRPLLLKPGAFETFAIESKELSNYRYHSAYSNYRYKSGDKPAGWIVRAKVGDEVVRVKASSPQLEQLEKDKAQFDKFVASMRP